MMLRRKTVAVRSGSVKLVVDTECSVTLLALHALVTSTKCIVFLTRYYGRDFIRSCDFSGICKSCSPVKTTSLFTAKIS